LSNYFDLLFMAHINDFRLLLQCRYNVYSGAIDSVSATLTGLFADSHLADWTFSGLVSSLTSLTSLADKTFRLTRRFAHGVVPLTNGLRTFKIFVSETTCLQKKLSAKRPVVVHCQINGLSVCQVCPPMSSPLNDYQRSGLSAKRPVSYTTAETAELLSTQ